MSRTAIAFQYEFVSGREPRYDTRIRSLIIRNQRARKARELTRKRESPSPTEGSATADARNLLNAQLDPFDTLGLGTDPSQNRMLYHYLNNCIPNLGTRSTKDSFFPPRDLDWQNIRESALLRSAAIQFAALSVALVESGSEDHVKHARQYYAKTIQDVRKQLEAELAGPSDVLLHTMTGLIATETHIRRAHAISVESEANLTLHIQGLRAALERRNGWDFHHYNPAVQWELLWQNVVVNGRLSAGKTCFSAHIMKMVNADGILKSGSTFQQQWDHLCALEFIGAYTDFYLAAQRRWEEADESSKCPSPAVQELFVSGTQVYKTMCLDGHTVIDSVAPIILVNIIFLDLQDASTEEATYRHWALRKNFRRCDVELGSGPAYLFYALGMTTNMKAWTEPEQILLVARMMSVVTKMSKSSRVKLKSTLLSFIAGIVDDDAEWWSASELQEQMCKEEIIEAQPCRESVAFHVE